MGSRSPDLHYVPYGDLAAAATPNVVVDGSPNEGTVLCLSHWPGIDSPSAFGADTSAQMAFAYLRALDRHPGAHAVSNNHFDQDGLVGVFALAHPARALARRALLVEVARAGDFAVATSRHAARVSMVISAFAEPSRSPLAGVAGPGGRPDGDDDAWTALLYTELLGRLPELCDNLEPYRALWEDEDATLSESEAALAAGIVTITEEPALDLAVVEVAAGAPDGGGHRFGGQWATGLHPMAVHNATERGAVLTARGAHYEFVYRYESWVQFRTRAVRPRVDLAPLAARLTEAEADAGGTATWEATRVSGLTPTLAPAGGAESALALARVRALVEAHLGSAPPAWDPYRITR
ncbi:MAG TPA: DUF6687 family protein [Acidimicrobiales bacterium]|nr:DUF6687 family protein [Acidimicrobiales bacterium]